MAASQRANVPISTPIGIASTGRQQEADADAVEAHGKVCQQRSV